MQPLLIHIHVPKCAGTTVETHFSHELGPGGTWFALKRTRSFPLGWFSHKYDPVPPGPLDQIRAVSGHFIGRSIENFFRNRRIVRSIILREPKSLMLSYYNYRMMRYISLGQRPYSFSLFLNATRQDFITHFLLERWFEMPWLEMMRLSDEKKTSLIDSLMSSLDYVADIRDTDSFIQKIAAEIDASPVAPPRNTAEEWRRGTGWQPLTLSDLSESEKDKLSLRTTLDRYVWRRWVLKDSGSPYGGYPTRFASSEFFRSKYQCQRRLARSFGINR